MAAGLSSCESSSSLVPVRASEYLAQSPISSVFSHNDVNSPKMRDCYEVGPLPDRTRRALVTWLHDSVEKDFSYVNPQYYITTARTQGQGEVVWALCSDNQGNLVGVLVPRSRSVAAWDLPTIGNHKLLVYQGPDKEALSTAIMESLADAGYDNVRINILKAQGVTERDHLISKPLNPEEQRLMEQERKARLKAMAEAKKKAKEEAKQLGISGGDDEDDTSDSDSSSDDSSDSSSGSDDEEISFTSDDDDSSSSSGGSDDEDSSSLDDEDTGDDE